MTTTKIRNWLLISSICLATSSLGFAETTTPKDDDSSKIEEPSFTGAAQAGFLMNTGDTQETTGNVKLSGTQHTDGKQWTNKGYVSAYNDSDHTDKDTEERYELFAQTQYNLSDKNYTFVNTDFLADSSDGYDYIWNSTIGYGRTLFHSNDYGMNLDWLLGPGYRLQPSDDEDIKTHEFTANSSLQFQWKINEMNTFEQDVNVSYAANDTILTSNTSFTAHIYKSLALQLGLTVHHDTMAPEDSSSTDTLTTVNLLYSF
jgi:putative salt-induced outer membrane protein YdiY